MASAVDWTPGLVLRTLGVFALAGATEIGGGWLVWQAVREGRPWWWALLGSAVLVGYGFVPTLQPAEAMFGRVFAVYGGCFIFLSYVWGWLVDGQPPDRGDIVGGCVATAGALIAWFWPRVVGLDKDGEGTAEGSAVER